MTLEAMIGRLLVVGTPGPAISPDWAQHLRHIHAGGYIPFVRNWESADQFRALVREFEEAVQQPALVMVDHEGGRWARFSGPGVTAFPEAAAMGGRGPEAVREQGRIEGRELRALDVDVNLAPVVDVLADGSDPIIGGRSYGRDAARVSTLAVARLRGLQETGGVSACAKHFPGLGAVPKDPHTHLPTLALDWEEMRAVHLAPFVATIAAGVACIMSSHVVYPTLDPGPPRPATFSQRLIHDLLRLQMGFRGAILTDDLEMGALRGLGTIGDAAVHAVEAGHDLLLICADQTAQRQAFDALRAAYTSGRLSTHELELSLARIDRLRREKSGPSP